MQDTKDIDPLPTIRLAASKTARDDYLDCADVSALLDYLRDHARHLWPIATLQALAGLRVYEAAFLRRCDVDWDRRTIQITDHPLHALKTASSRRTLPVCNEVIECMAAVANEQVVIPPDGELFLTLSGRLWSKNSMGSAWQRYVQGWRPTKVVQEGEVFTRRVQSVPVNERIASVPQRRLRASFATMVGRLGVDDAVLQVYLGHSPKDILSRHYRQIGVEDLRAVPLAIGKLWLEKAYSAWMRASV